jgi:hypothetical protein
VIEQDDPEARSQLLRDEAPQILVAPKPMGEHDRRAVRIPDDVNVVPGDHIHSSILGPSSLRTLDT